MQEEYGAEDGSTDSLVTNTALDNMGKDAGMARKELIKVAKSFMSDARIQKEIAAAKKARQPLEEYWADTVVLAKEIHEGRNTSDLTPKQFGKHYTNALLLERIKKLKAQLQLLTHK